MVKLVGILNITPDSFSDGGKYMAVDAALVATAQMIMDGADIIDIGAESTRPGALPVSSEEEWTRLSPVLSSLAKNTVFSVDTRHAETAKKALAAGAAYINDVSGFNNPAMIEVVRDSDCKLVVMHSLSVPADKNMVLPDDADVIKELLDFANTRMGYLEKMRISRERLIFDPGIGFGKTAKQSYEIIERIDELKILGVPLYIGHSRKSFLNAVDRDVVTLEVSRALIQKKIDYLRVHDLRAHRGMHSEMSAYV